MIISFIIFMIFTIKVLRVCDDHRLPPFVKCYWASDRGRRSVYDTSVANDET